MVRRARRIGLPFLCLLLGIASVPFPQAQIQVGYTLVTADAGSSVPVGTALFSVTNPLGVLVSQAGVGATEPILSGRIFVDETGPLTGIALVNPSQQDAAVTLILRDSRGKEVGRISQPLPAGGHLATFVYQLFRNLPVSFTGSLTFESNQKIAAVALRQNLNAGGEPLYTTLPVADLAAAATAQSLLFPQIAAGAGYTTQLLLINTTTQILKGSISLADSDGNPLSLLSNAVPTSQIPYSIEPQGIFRADLYRPGDTKAGYALLVPDAGLPPPAGSAVFQYRKNQAIVTEAAVAATTLTSSARIFVDNVASYTGVALANPADQSALVTFTLLDRYGASLDSTSRTLPARGHIAVFAHELFPALSGTFTGLMEINCPTPVAPITLKLVINQQNDLILTTLPVADLTRPPTATSVVFPHIAIGGGLSTRLICINTDKTRAIYGALAFFRSDASAMSVPLGGRTDSRFSYQLPAGGGRQLLPGNTAAIASISLLDSSTSQTTKEVVINQGQSLRPGVLVLDSTGLPRDDFDLSFASLSTEVATVDSTGSIQGKKAGFSTLTLSGGNVVAAGTITVVSVSSGSAGFEIAGIAQDPARRIYLASSGDHTILRAPDLSQTPEVYAGTAKTPGLRNAVRLQSLFNGPTFLAFNQARGTLYVSDSGNNVVRAVPAGQSGTVSTLAGGFNNPRGIALDHRGNLWLADAGSHTIRRINLTSASAESIAGQAGSAGWQDGRGAGARFSYPAGIAVETEPLAAQLERERQGIPPPPVSVLVADSGNNVIRRVKETGEVETIRTTGSSAPSVRAAASVFFAPVAVATDPFGNIYVSETGAAGVKVLLRSGEIVAAAQAGTFKTPTGMAVSRTGRILVAERNRPVQQIAYGEPQITSVTPDRVGTKGGSRVTIKGKNFAPDSQVVVAGVVISAPTIANTETITFTAPVLLSGLAFLTVQNRGGLTQSPLMVDPLPLSELPQGYITTVAGGSTFAGEGSPATSVSLSASGVAVDSAGNVILADIENYRVRKIDPASGAVTTIAGNGRQGRTSESGLATALSLFEAGSVSFDAAGNLYILDGNVRKVDASTGIISTVVRGEYGFCGDGGKASAACMNYAVGIAADSAGNLFIADRYNQRVRKVDASTGIISTFAGNGQPGSSGDGGPARSASLNEPFGVAVDEAVKALYIADSANNRIRRVDLTTEIITTFAGGGSPADGLGDNLKATAARLDWPWYLALDPDGNLYVTDRNNGRVRKVDIAAGTITTVAGGGRNSPGDGGPATAAALSDPEGIAVDGAGNLLITESYRYTLRKVDAGTGIITTIAGNGLRRELRDGAPAAAATLTGPEGITADAAGNLWITDTDNQRIRKVDAATRVITTVAGGGTSDPGDGGPAIKAALADPRGAVDFDRDGNLYLADYGHNTVRKVDVRTGIISRVAGTGEAGFSGDGGKAVDARMHLPSHIAIDTRRGLLYVIDSSESDNCRIRVVNLADGTIDTLRGISDGGTLPAPLMGDFKSIALDSAGNLFSGQMIVPTETSRVRKVDAVSRVISTVAGGGTSAEEDVAATSARLAYAFGIAIDSGGNLFILDYPDRVRRVDAATGKIVTVAGGDRDVPFADGGPALQAWLYYPYGIALDMSGNLFIADTDNHRIRAVKGPFK